MTEKAKKDLDEVLDTDTLIREILSSGDYELPALESLGIDLDKDITKEELFNLPIMRNMLETIERYKGTEYEDLFFSVLTHSLGRFIFVIDRLADKEEYKDQNLHGAAKELFDLMCDFIKSGTLSKIPYTRSPSSAATSLFENLLITKDPVKMRNRRRSYSHRKEDPFELYGDETQSGGQDPEGADTPEGEGQPEQPQTETATVIVYKGSTDQFALRLEDRLKIVARSSQVFEYIMQEINKQCIQNKHFIRKEAYLDIAELTASGMYNSMDVARREVQKIVDVISMIPFDGTIEIINEETNKKETIKNPRFFPFSYHGLVKGTGKYKLEINDKFPYELFYRHFTILPDYYKSLSERAFNLIKLIFDQARQNAGALKAGQPFRIYFRAICTRCNLPTEAETKETRHYKRDIVQPIRDIIDELRRWNDKYYYMEVHEEETGIIREYLDRSYILIGIDLNSPYYEPLTEMKDRQDRIIIDNIEKGKQKKTAAIKALTKKK